VSPRRDGDGDANGLESVLGASEAPRRRWRPAYHLELLLCLWMLAVDYGTTREAYHNRQSDWLRATECLWVNTPPDVPQRVAEVFRSDSRLPCFWPPPGQLDCGIKRCVATGCP